MVVISAQHPLTPSAKFKLSKTPVPAALINPATYGLDLPTVISVLLQFGVTAEAVIKIAELHGRGALTKKGEFDARAPEEALKVLNYLNALIQSGELKNNIADAKLLVAMLGKNRVYEIANFSDAKLKKASELAETVVGLAKNAGSVLAKLVRKNPGQPALTAGRSWVKSEPQSEFEQLLYTYSCWYDVIQETSNCLKDMTLDREQGLITDPDQLDRTFWLILDQWVECSKGCSHKDVRIIAQIFGRIKTLRALIAPYRQAYGATSNPSESTRLQAIANVMTRYLKETIELCLVLGSSS